MPTSDYADRLGDLLEQILDAGAQEIGEIVRQLNDAGSRTPQGGPWSVESFQAELRRLAD